MNRPVSCGEGSRTRLFFPDNTNTPRETKDMTINQIQQRCCYTISHSHVFQHCIQVISHHKRHTYRTPVSHPRSQSWTHFAVLSPLTNPKFSVRDANRPTHTLILHGLHSYYRSAGEKRSRTRTSMPLICYITKNIRHA